MEREVLGMACQEKWKVVVAQVVGRSLGEGCEGPDRICGDKMGGSFV